MANLVLRAFCHGGNINACVSYVSTLHMLSIGPISLCHSALIFLEANATKHRFLAPLMFFFASTFGLGKAWIVCLLYVVFFSLWNGMLAHCCDYCLAHGVS